MSAKNTYTMVIELRSDMCCGTGEANGVSVDQVTALDLYGLPVIPAKRLKGLLREEAALIGDDALVNELFGESGRSQAGKLAFGEARPVGYERLVRHIQASRGAITPGLVAKVYTTSRTGTRIEDDGVVANHTLRTIQFVRRCDTTGAPMRFVCTIRGTDLTKEQMGLVDDAVRCLRAIGLGKSRGMGEVSCRGSWTEDRLTLTRRMGSEGGCSRIGYRIELTSPAAVQSGTGESLDYIPGSVMQGMFAWLFCKSDPDFFERHILRGTRFGNAYVCVDDSSLSAPVPLSCRTQKNAAGTRDEGSGTLRYPLYDMAEGEAQDGVQQVAIDGYGALVDGMYEVAKVSQSLSFHSSSQNSPQGKQYYSIKSIDADQVFCGTIVAAPEAIQRLRDVGSQHANDLRIGTAKGSGFGACSLDFFDVEDVQNVGVRTGDRVTIQLLSDVVYIDEDGNNTTDVASFATYLSQRNVLGFSFDTSLTGDNPCRVFAKTCVVGGFNAYWHLPKRQYVAFKKGSVIVATVTACAVEEVPREAWTGLLQAEGYGHLAIRKVGEDSIEGGYAQVGGSNSTPGPAADVEPQRVAAHDDEMDELARKAVTSFEHDLMLYDVLDKAMLKACELGGTFERDRVSKSSFMRIGSIASSACDKTEDVLYSAEFIRLAKDSFEEDEKVLYAACATLKEAYDLLMADSDKLSMYAKNLVFKRFVLEYLHQVKVGYTMARENAHD